MMLYDNVKVLERGWNEESDKNCVLLYLWEVAEVGQMLMPSSTTIHDWDQNVANVDVEIF